MGAIGAVLVVTIAMLWVLSPVARRMGLVDRPGGRKDHDGEIPLTGGIAMFIGLCVGILLTEQISGNQASLVMIAGLLLFVGMLDDIVFLSAYSRLLVQICASLMVILYTGYVLEDVGYLFDSEHLILLSFASIPFTLFSVAGVTNATNMSDGMDGLAGGLVLIVISALFVVAWISGKQELLPFLGSIVAVLVAFLAFNMRTPWRARAHIFMGNGGSMFLGFLSAWLLIQFSQGTDRAMPPVVALWIFALPLLDTVCIMLRRILKGRSPFAPDREHLHHILLLAGYTVNQTVWILLGIAASMATLGIAAYFLGLPEYVLTYSFLVVAGIYFLAMQRAWRIMKVIHRHKLARHARGSTEVMHTTKRVSQK